MCPNVMNKIKEQACKVKPQMQTTQYSSAHDDISVESDEKREIKGQNEELRFEHDKPSTSENQGANVPSEKCSTSEAYTDLLVTTPKDQQDKKIKSGDPVGKQVQPVSKTGLTGFHKMNTTKSNKWFKKAIKKSTDNF
jgi:hypothetical protein